jgi:hypothetical protein
MKEEVSVSKPGHNRKGMVSGVLLQCTNMLVASLLGMKIYNTNSIYSVTCGQYFGLCIHTHAVTRHVID